MKKQDKRKITIIGAGFVGSTTAYSLISSQLADEVALIDINAKLVKSQVMDLQHSVPFWGNMLIKVGSYRDVKDSDIVIVTAGAGQKPGETRLDLIKKNSVIIKSIATEVFKKNPRVIMIIVTNPVDLLTYQVIKMFPSKKHKIIGSGTMLDTARLRFLLGQHFKVNPRNIHAYIIGEHGDSEFPLWSTANIGQIPLKHYPSYNASKMEIIAKNARNAAYTIIKGKQATYYAIGAAVTKLVKTILGDKHSVVPVSNLLTNYHGVSNVCLSVPTVVGARGIIKQLKLQFTPKEKELLKRSAQKLKSAAKDLVK